MTHVDQQTAADLLSTYLAQVDVDQRRLATTKPSDSVVRTVAKRAVPRRLRGTARLVLTRALAGRERVRAQEALRGPRPLLLHLGSGAEHKDDWVNIDLAGDPVELAWDLSRPLPFPTECVDGIFHEHLLEHLSLADGLHLTKECYRVLRPGGLLRVGVPDVALLLHQYVAEDPALLDERTARPTGLLAVQELFYWHRHLTMYDEETLSLVLAAAGLCDARRKMPGESCLPAAPDTERRKARTLYVEAVKR